MNWILDWRTRLVMVGGALILFAIIASGLGVGQAKRLIADGLDRQQAKSLEIFGDAPAFTLTDHLEWPVSLDDLQGKVVVANFIYTNCTDICPLLSLRMQALQERLREEQLLGSQVQLLSFTVDPTRDTTEVLRAYAERHQADPDAWRFLTGPEEAVKPLIVDGFHLGTQALPPEEATPSAHDDDEHPDPSYEVMHSGRFVLLDPQGRIRAYYDGRDLDLDQVVQDIRQVLP
jgi:cytochrome oxidase Cu insertion factor (SCO1/SenC/PrrC family)